MERTEIIRILKEEGYPDFMLEKTTDKIEAFSSVVQKAFEEWFNNKQQSNIIVEGFAFTDLLTQWGMKPIGAFITLDWLLREPESAKNALTKGIK